MVLMAYMADSFILLKTTYMWCMYPFSQIRFWGAFLFFSSPPPPPPPPPPPLSYLGCRNPALKFL